MAILQLAPALKDAIWRHLLPTPLDTEQGAFLLCRCSHEDELTFEVIEPILLKSEDFSYQEGDYLELKDQRRLQLIVQAHRLGASIVEFHSHLGEWPAAFSHSDKRGLRETVQHMWWRLKGRPYLAVVVSSSGLDALVWENSPDICGPLKAIAVGPELLFPTNITIAGGLYGMSVR